MFFFFMAVRCFLAQAVLNVEVFFSCSSLDIFGLRIFRFKTFCSSQLLRRSR